MSTFSFPEFRAAPPKKNSEKVEKVFLGKFEAFQRNVPKLFKGV
jgi:hypothetical protein